MKYLKPFLFFCWLFICNRSYAQVNSVPTPKNELQHPISADTSSKFYVSEINVIGNKKTKDYIITREIPLKVGDSVSASQLYPILQNARNLIYNTTLFIDVQILPLALSGRDLILNVIVQERWYIIPLPQFKLPDSEIVRLPNADFTKAIYGARFTHYNFSGRGDQLHITLVTGYTRAVNFSYKAPYSNARLTEGFTASTNFSQGREFAYKTSVYNGLYLYRKDGFSRTSFSANFTYQMRRGYYWRHFFTAQYNYIRVADSINTIYYNPNYLNTAKNYISFPDLSYGFQYINVNNVNYPLTGQFYSFGILKRGLGIKGNVNLLTADASARRYLAHGKNFYSTFELFGGIKLPFRQAYINQRAFSYGGLYLRGLEKYTIDGYANMLGRYTFSKKLVSFKIPLPFHIKAVPNIPFSIFAKTFVDYGFVLNKKEFDTRLNNISLYTAGFGIDILTLYDFSLRLEWGFNQLGENGLILHTRGGF